mgnify:CR=1 FL=1
MIYDRLDGTKTEINTGPIGILRQAGLEITMEDDGYTEIDFSEVGGYQAASRYREMFLQMRSEGMERTEQSSAVIGIQIKKGSALDSHVALPAYILGKAIDANDQLGQKADAVVEKMSAKPTATIPSVAGASGFALTPEA